MNAEFSVLVGPVCENKPVEHVDVNEMMNATVPPCERGALEEAVEWLGARLQKGCVAKDELRRLPCS